jgi:hypothetical protein
LFVEVNVGNGGMERIVVYEGDTAEDLAREFCDAHSLDAATEEKLRVLLKQQMGGVLSKIEEQARSEDDESQA